MNGIKAKETIVYSQCIDDICKELSAEVEENDIVLEMEPLKRITNDEWVKGFVFGQKMLIGKLCHKLQVLDMGWNFYEAKGD